MKAVIIAVVLGMASVLQAAELQYKLIEFSGDLPAVTEINRLIDKGFLEKGASGSISILESGSFVSEETVPYTYSTNFADSGDALETTTTKLGHELKGDCTIANGFYSFKMDFYFQEKIRDHVHVVKEGRAVVQPVFNKLEMPVSITLESSNQWSVIGGLVGRQGERKLLALRVIK